MQLKHAPAAPSPAQPRPECRIPNWIQHARLRILERSSHESKTTRRETERAYLAVRRFEHALLQERPSTLFEVDFDQGGPLAGGSGDLRRLRLRNVALGGWIGFSALTGDGTAKSEDALLHELRGRIESSWPVSEKAPLKLDPRAFRSERGGNGVAAKKLSAESRSNRTAVQSGVDRDEVMKANRSLCELEARLGEAFPDVAIKVTYNDATSDAGFRDEHGDLRNLRLVAQEARSGRFVSFVLVPSFSALEQGKALDGEALARQLHPRAAETLRRLGC